MNISSNDQGQHLATEGGGKASSDGVFPVATLDPESREVTYRTTRDADRAGSDFARRLGSALEVLRDDDQEATAPTQPKTDSDGSQNQTERSSSTPPDATPETVTPAEARDKPQSSFFDAVLDSKITDGLIVAGLFGLAVLAAPVSGPLALGAAAVAISVVADVVTHRSQGDKEGFLRRGGSIIKALTAGAAVALLPVTSIGGAVAACAAVWISEVTIADKPDSEGSLLAGDVIPRLAKWSGVDVDKVAKVVKKMSSVLPLLPLILVGIGVLLFGRRKMLESNAKKTAIASRVARPVRAVAKGAVAGWAANGLTSISSSLI